MNSFKNNTLALPSFILAFIFCGAIVGETASISLAVTTLKPQILSKFYLINGILLYGLPFLFLSKIDRIDRSKLLTRQLITISFIIFALLLTLILTSSQNLPFSKIILFAMYPLSYLSKTILFLTFWTLANDIFPTSEAKKTFPVIAAWGMAGGLFGACAARMLVTVFPTEGIIVIWILSFLVAWFFSEKAQQRFQDRLRFREDLPTVNTHLFADASDVLTIKMVRIMAILYFLVFISIFSFDYLFWDVCHQWFETSESLASFQFTFYLLHALVTIVGLILVIPLLIAKIGFTKLLYCLPAVLLSGSGLLLVLQYTYDKKIFFTAFLCIQFFRYVIFENAFSPIYQMFFAAIEKEKRGRAKTLLEGIIKPGAILSSGLLLIALSHNRSFILILVIISSIATIFVVLYLRKIYTQSLIPEISPVMEPRRIIADAATYEEQKLQSIIKDYAEAEDQDMRIVSVKLLAGIGSHQAFDTMVAIYDKENYARIKEFIAKSIADFYWYQTRPFMERLLNDTNPRIRSNALQALNRMNCNWKRHLKNRIRQLLFDDNMRVQIEAARYLWTEGELHEKENISSFLNNLINNTSPNRKSAGIYLIGLLHLKGWENILLENLSTHSLQVFTKCVEVIMRSCPASIRAQALEKIENLSREHIAIAGRVIERSGGALLDTIIEYLPKSNNRRMIFEMIRCLRIIADSIRLSGKTWSIKDSASETIQAWVHSELEVVYKDCYIRAQMNSKADIQIIEILDQALYENIIRVCEWAVNAMVLLDKRGLLVWRHTDIDIRENAQKMDLIEILESSSYQKLGALVLPLLKNESWNAIAKTGRSSFNFEDTGTEDTLLYFLRSDNRWVVLCTLYVINANYDKYMLNEKSVEILKMLLHDSNRQVAGATRNILDKQNDDERKRSEAFILLEKVLFFKKTHLFKNVSAEKLMRLAEISQYAIYEKNTVISVQGEVSDHLYIVKKGNLNVVKSDSETKTVISSIQCGETYGEIGLFNQAPRSASAIASDACELYIIKRGPFKKLLLEVPEIAYNMLEAMSERLRKNGEEIIEMKKQFNDTFFTQKSD
jgi:CRP-like cAMP-binding protein